MVPEPGGPGGPLAPPIFGRPVNPIPTMGGRFCPPFTSGTPNVFHLPASLGYTLEMAICVAVNQLKKNSYCFRHCTITKPLCLSCRFAQIPAQFGSILCYLSCLFMFLLPCSIVSSAEFSAKLFFRRQNDDVGRRRSELRRLFREITRLTRIFL